MWTRKWQVEKRAVFLEPALLIKGPLVSMGHLSPHQRLCLITDTVQYTNNTTHHHHPPNPPPTHPPTDGGDVRFGVSSTSEPSQKKHIVHRFTPFSLIFFFGVSAASFVLFARRRRCRIRFHHEVSASMTSVNGTPSVSFCVCVLARVCVCVCQWLTEDISKPVTPNQQRGGTV